ncbi:hypothetical protein [Henriciella aquimarina]|uniref:hypothetical protein n=1 Tax=Henriciella aquimarina TaxID=545261 RepID=UPI000A040E9A|nr:hypothetical protein [Henriciella aquimarina]
MRLIIAYFAFVAALLIALPVFGAQQAKADATPSADAVESTPASAESGLLVHDGQPMDVDSYAI